MTIMIIVMLIIKVIILLSMKIIAFTSTQKEELKWHIL